MAYIPTREYGRYGVIQDTPSETLKLGSWSDALNVRFTGGHIEKMLESAPLVATVAGRPSTSITGNDCKFCITWADGFSTYLLAVFRQSDGRDYVYRWDQRTAQPDASNPAAWDYIGPVDGSGDPVGYDAGPWQGFQWGNTVIINNGTTAPQVWNDESQRMQALPNWGLISTADDIINNAAPSDDTEAACRMIIPLANYLVALSVTERGARQTNKVWWSDAASVASIDGAPSWDYESPVTLSAQSEVGIGFGDIVTAAPLNNNLIIYTDGDCTAMSVVGGRFVMQFRRLFNKGAAGLHSLCEYENKHFVVARDQIYAHDGSTPFLIAQDRVEREFYKRIGKKDSINVY